MREWYILGAGAIGCLFAANLQQAGTDCRLILRKADQAGCTITLEDAAGSSRVAVAATVAAADSPIDRLLVTTKAYDVENALRSVRHRLPAGGTVLVLVNGMGLVEIAAAMLPDANVFAGTTTEGAYRKGPLQVYHAGRGVTRIGSTTPADRPPWFDKWRRAPLACAWDDDIESALWHKLAINCAINPLTALHRVRNGELVSDRTMRSAVTGLCEEIAAVSAAAGFHATARGIGAEALEVARRTADNKSSMLQDVLAGRRTEVDYITGYLVRRADALGVAADRNRELLQKVRELEP